MNFNQEQLTELAKKLGLNPSDVENEGNRIAFYLDRDIEETSLYNIARVVIEPDTEQIVAHCTLCNATGKVAHDTAKTYPKIDLALEDIKVRFEHLRAPYQPRKKPERKVANAKVRYIH